MAAPDDFDRVGDLLGDFCEVAAKPTGQEGEADSPNPKMTVEAASKHADVSRLLASAWPQIVGPEVAANATPVQLKAGRLVVSTSSSVWAQTLQYMGDDLTLRLNERLGRDAVKAISFRHAGWEEHSRVGQGQAVATSADAQGLLTAEQTKALEELEALDLPADIRSRVAAAMRASFVRSQQNPVR